MFPSHQTGFLCRKAKYPQRLSLFSRGHQRAFSLMELLIVAGIIVIIMGLVVPVFRTEKTPSNAAYGVAGVFDQARSYAMANSTYVFVGLFEEDGSQPSPAPNASAKAGVGRVVIAAVASKDGMSGYDDANKTWTFYGNGNNLLALGKLWRFEVTSLSETRLTDSTGGMVRPALDSNGILIKGTTATTTPFSWPLGKALGSGQYQFQTVICFSPQGVARVLDADHPDFTAIPSLLELGLLTAHGNVASSGSNVAAIQIDSITGATRVYRP